MFGPSSLFAFDRQRAGSPGGLLFGPALEVITASGTAIGAALAPLTAVAGDSLAVRSFDSPKVAKILQHWNDVQVAGTSQLRSAKLHDNVRGIRIDTIVSEPVPLLPWGVGQRVYQNDTLIQELAGSAVAGDIEFVASLFYYEDLPGGNARLITVDELMRRATNISGVENTLALGTAGGYSGAEAINAENDQFHASAEYAIVGYIVDTECAVVGYRGADTSNFRVGGPGIETFRDITADWFVRLARAFNLPLIPVMRAENKANTQIDGAQDENGADTTVITYCVELSPR